MEDNSEFGVRVLTGNDVESTELSLLQPRVQWTCWIIQKIHLAFHFGTMLTWWAILSGGLLIFSYLVYKVYKWQQERVLTEKQDVFELVEQVLSLLVNQHQAAMRGGVVARPYLAINHIRDQLIAPQDRKRKKRLWNKVVEYIQESESRVREEVQVKNQSGFNLFFKTVVCKHKIQF
jgi:membrane protein Man1